MREEFLAPLFEYRGHPPTEGEHGEPLRLAVASSLLGALGLLRLAPAGRSAGTRITAAALLATEAPRSVERFLFFTGDLGSEDATAFALRCTRPILRKPFHIEELASRVEEVAAKRAVVG